MYNCVDSKTNLILEIAIRNNAILYYIIQKDISAATLIKFRNKAQLYLSLVNCILYFLIVYFVKNVSVVQLYNCTIST